MQKCLDHAGNVLIVDSLSTYVLATAMVAQIEGLQTQYAWSTLACRQPYLVGRRELPDYCKQKVCTILLCLE